MQPFLPALKCIEISCIEMHFVIFLCLFKICASLKVSEISEWSNLALIEQNLEREKDLKSVNLDELNKIEAIDKYFELATKTFQDHCHIQKRISGQF